MTPTRREAMSLAVCSVCRGQNPAGILDLPPVPSDARIAYGSLPSQFADLRLPATKPPHRLVIVIHGGFWKAAYNLDHIGHLCAALTAAGVATWSLEYRRIGDPGGGWRGTFDDVVLGAQALRDAARKYNLDLAHVAATGHSAGGHLALYLAAMSNISLRGVTALAPVADLRRAYELRLSNGIVEKLLGGTPDQAPERYRSTSPIEMLPIGVPQTLVHGSADTVVPIELSERFTAKSPNAKLIRREGAGHFELIDPRTPQWGEVCQAILGTL